MEVRCVVLPAAGSRWVVCVCWRGSGLGVWHLGYICVWIKITGRGKADGESSGFLGASV